MKKSLCIIFLLLCISQISYGQLSNFTLTVTKTDESCTGNGSLSFNVSNTTAGSTIIYRLYKLPDLVNTIAVLSTNTFGGLASGTYRVIATQTLGNSSGTQQQDITILDTRTYLTYQLSSTATNCDTGNINVNVLTGNPVSYEILTGPVTVAPQPSSTFTNLHAGTYNIRVNDACGEGVVQTYTLTFSNPPNLTISNPQSDCPLVTCQSLNLSYSINASGATGIRYPLTVQLTVFPPGGGTPIIFNQTITSGDLSSVSLSNVVPLYYGQIYTYSITVTDGCGKIYLKPANQINLRLLLQGKETYTNCVKGIQLNLCNFLPPYNVNFLSAPAGFNPTTYNGLHPGPFTSSSTSYVSTPTSEIPNGTYSIQVTDACNHTATCEVIVVTPEPLYLIKIEPTTCDINTYIQIPQNDLIGPFITSAVITSSTADLGSPIPYDVSANIHSGILLMQLPPGTYTIEGMDVCGHPYSYTFTMPPKNFTVTVTPSIVTGCSASGLGSIKVVSLGALLTSINITAAPSNLNQTLPYNVSFLIPPTGSSSVVIPNLPPGDYTLLITDSCNNTYIRSVTIVANISLQPLSFYEKKGCGDNYDSIALVSPNGRLQTVIVTSAPTSFPFPLPYNVSFNIASNGIFYMNSFPEGTYTFYTKDTCDQERTATYAIVGYHQGGTINVVGNCGSFDLNMNFIDNTLGQLPTYWLQKFDAVTNQWVHPLTGIVFPANSLPNATNSYILTNFTSNYNIAATGTFRILTKFDYFSNATSVLSNCVQTIKTFDYNGDLKILSAYAIPCVNGGSQVFIIATGVPPLNYKITTKDGQPFLVDNGTSNSFSGLQSGVYNFKVQDVCGNVVNRQFDITTLQLPVITASNLCDGLNGQLSIQPFSFLNYEWWKDNNTTTILSTTNTLNFTPFTNANAGVYHVRISSSTTNSCVDRVLEYAVSPSSLPNAGLDGSKIICGSSIVIDLFTLLNGTYDVGGTWEETTSSGMLVGSNWSPAGLSPGIYVFKYTVNGFCNSTDDAMVTITIKSAVQAPVINANTPYCPGEDLEFSIDPTVGAVYQWTGPNNFSSALQNPTITNATAVNAGTYTVKVTVDQCEAQSTIIVNSKPLPDYTHEESCAAGLFRVEIIPTEGSLFDPTTATYSWTGPNNFTSTDNPIIITNQPIGVYSVVVTNNEGCFIPQTINISNTFCDFPNVITPGGDGFNDSLDLTNYGVELFQVFSRWGRLVYEENNYTKGWYGQNMHGGFLPDSTYYYFVRLRNGQEKHGWIYVGRG